MHIMEPSQVVSEAYRTDVIVTHSGRVVTGRIVPSADFRQSAVWVSTNPLRPDLVESIPKPDIESHTPSTASVMPTGLLSTLTREEILDLLAYLERPMGK
jgi:putative heme-binding domain-containing protein